MDPALGVPIAADAAGLPSSTGVFPLRFVLSHSMDEGMAPKKYTGGLMAEKGGKGNGSVAEGKEEAERREGEIRIRNLGE